MNPAPPTRPLHAVLLVASSVSLTLAAGEGWARLGEGHRLRIAHATRHHALKPMTSSPAEAWGSGNVPVAVNSLGMRDAEPREAPLDEPGVRRVLFLGDSFTEGVGATYEDTMVHQAELLLSANLGRRVACLNGGVASYCPVLEYVTLRELLGRGLRVDAVVLVLDVSDPQDEILYRILLGDSYAATVAPEGSGRAFHSGTFLRFYGASALVRKVASLLARASRGREGARVWRDGYYPDRRDWMNDDELLKRWGTSGLDLMAENVRRIKGVLAAHGLPLLLVAYPWPAMAAPGAPVSAYERRVRELAADERIPLVDLFPAFRSQPDLRDYFIGGDVHWTPRGHRFVAEHVAKRIAEELERRP